MYHYLKSKLIPRLFKDNDITTPSPNISKHIQPSLQRCKIIYFDPNLYFFVNILLTLLKLMFFSLSSLNLNLKLLQIQASRLYACAAY